MGNASIIARRLQDGHVQYGWSGNGGYFGIVGMRLLLWYQKPEDVEYLFELGQTRFIGRKGSELGGFPRFESHALIEEPFWLGRTERTIFSKSAFIDYGYFYDLDHRWYYIIPGPFRIKMPLELIEENLDEDGKEFEYVSKIEDKILKYIFIEYIQNDRDFKRYLDREGYCPETVMENIKDEGKMLVMKLYDHYRRIYEYFDDWILIKANDENTDITEIVLKKKGEEHLETIQW